MKLLFDQNISYKVSKGIKDIFPDAMHLSDLGLLSTKDIEIWEFAKVNDYCIVSFDYDFVDLSMLRGYPPQDHFVKNRKFGNGRNNFSNKP